MPDTPLQRVATQPGDEEQMSLAEIDSVRSAQDGSELARLVQDLHAEEENLRREQTAQMLAGRLAQLEPQFQTQGEGPVLPFPEPTEPSAPAPEPAPEPALTIPPVVEPATPEEVVVLGGADTTEEAEHFLRPATDPGGDVFRADGRPIAVTRDEDRGLLGADPTTMDADSQTRLFADLDETGAFTLFSSEGGRDAPVFSITGETAAAAGGIPAAIRAARVRGELTDAQAQIMLRRFPELRPPSTGAGAETGPLVESVFEQQMGARPSAEALLGAAEADAAVNEARKRQTVADLEQVVAQAEAAQALGQRQAQLALERRNRADEVRRQLDDRLAAADAVMEAARADRVDPEEFYGGPAGRVAAGLAVALGQIASAIGGGENTALRIIEQGVDRSIRAQMANQQASLRSAGQAQNAFQMFRQILDDETAAEEMARAAEIQAYSTRLQGLMHGLRGPRLEAARTLLARLQEQGAAHQRVASERAAHVTRLRVLSRRRGGADPEGRRQQLETQQSARDASFTAGRLLDSAASSRGADAPEGSGEGAVPEAVTSAVDLAETAMQRGDPAGAAGIFFRVISEHGPSLSETQLESMQAQLRVALRADARENGIRVADPSSPTGTVYSTTPRARRAGQAAADGDRRARRTVEAERRRARRVSAANSVANFLLTDDEAAADYAGNQEAIRESTVFNGRPGLYVADDQNLAESNWAVPAVRQEIMSTVDGWLEVDALVSEIRRYREMGTSNVIDSGARQRMRAMWERFSQRSSREESGGQIPESEMERFLERWPDPTTVQGMDALRAIGFDQMLERWEGVRASIHDSANLRLRTRGFRLDTPRARRHITETETRRPFGGRRRRSPSGG